MADNQIPPETSTASNEAQQERILIEGRAPLEPEEADFDDPGYQDDLSALTQSIRSSVYDYRYENGRRYHSFKEGMYFAPNDEPEQDRMYIQAKAMTLASGQLLHHSPLKNPMKIIDLGTGTGMWAIEMGDLYPEAEIVGVDLSPIQPDWVPPNVKFEIDDIEDTWTWPSDHFDYIHASLLISGSIVDTRKYFTQAFRCLKPGGWCEDSELWSETKSDHVDIPESSAARRWANLMAEGIAKMGRSMRHDGADIKALMEDIGFVNVVHRPFKIPIGRWPADKVLKEAGANQLVAMIEGLQSLSLAIFTRALGWTQEEVELFLVEVRQDFQKKKNYMYWPGWVVYGQKPEDAPTATS